MNAVTAPDDFDAARTAAAGFHLENEGYCLVRRLVAPSVVARIDGELDRDFSATPFSQGPFYGERTKRFGRLLARSETVAALVLQPIVLALAERILGRSCDTIQLNVAQAIEIHPGALAQFPHRDQDMWRGHKNGEEYLINVIWPLTIFTARNGATLIWPDSHGERGDDALDTGAPVVAEAEPGDAIIFLGSTRHGAGANLSDMPRRAIVIGYSLGWLRSYENQALAYPPDIARRFSPELAALIGYRQHRPNLGNCEGQCPSILLNGPTPVALPAIDAMAPEVAEMLAAHAAEQRAAQRALRK